MSMPVYNKTIYADVKVARAMEKLKTLTYEKGSRRPDNANK